MEKDITLPSGKTAKIKEGLGKHLRMAQRKAVSPEDITFALISELAQIDGQPIVYEDLDDMPLKDVLMLVSEVAGDFPTRLPSSSSTSQAQQDGATES